MRLDDDDKERKYIVRSELTKRVDLRTEEGCSEVQRRARAMQTFGLLLIVLVQ